jgi:hypothetical protein
MFYEIDCGPGGIVWEMHSEESEYLRTYRDEGDMLYDAALLRKMNHEIKFYTQAEYNLNIEMETLVENEMFSPGLDNSLLSAL